MVDCPYLQPALTFSRLYIHNEYCVDMKEPEKDLEGNLSYIRHEFRSPLNAIIGYSEMLIEPHGTSSIRINPPAERSRKSSWRVTRPTVTWIWTFTSVTCAIL